ncbi:MAG: penicillin-binding transpeptidase domain-containing protein [Oscillospiraceae bacterium]|nr:penicillin-binding transpeptidase domain-containing protein [Oscillospiraceae bacterium]
MKGILEKLRAYFFVILTIAAACAGVYRLMKLQIVEGDSYLQKSRTTTVETQVIDAPRGEIVDASGNALVSNKSCFNVIVDKAFFPSDNSEINRIILRTAEILREEGSDWEDILPISKALPFAVDDTNENKVTEMRRHIGVQIYASPDQCIAAMCDNYGISDDYSAEEKRLIAGVRYTMDKRNFSVANTYTFSEDISMNTVIKIKEASFELDGIDIIEDAARTYGEGDVVPHLIGTVGAIDAEEYAELKAKGYAMDDSVGKSGIELAMESTLRGQKGTRTIEMQDGRAVSDVVSEEAVPGNTVKLTVDSDYQRDVQTILENHISWLQNQTLPDAAGTSADAGAIVVLNAKTGALLAAATAPTYNLNDYINSYSEVASRPNSPLTNRAVNGLYRPGSTFKTITATAALNEGIINTNTIIRCNSVYDYWEDYKPKCTGWHGSINVVTALKESCNIFFYETGRIMGIDTLRSYAELFGFGGEAGLETGRGLKRGYIACPETYDILGMDWQAGNIVQTAIGQSETAVTPLQMAAQAMTIANKGTRYQTYMVDSVYTYNMESLVSKTQPVIAAQIPDKTGYTFDTVIEGMKQAADFTEYNYPKPREKDYYTGKYLLSDLPCEAAIKTGTPQMTSQEDTGSAFIGFYPADDPEIAFAGFIEHGEYSKFMVRQIIEAYYNEDYEISLLSEGYVPKEHEPSDVLSDTEEDSSEDGFYEDTYTETETARTEPEEPETEPEETELTEPEEAAEVTEAPSETVTDTAETMPELPETEIFSDTLPPADIPAVTAPTVTMPPVTEEEQTVSAPDTKTSVSEAPESSAENDEIPTDSDTPPPESE